MKDVEFDRIPFDLDVPLAPKKRKLRTKVQKLIKPTTRSEPEKAKIAIEEWVTFIERFASRML